MSNKTRYFVITASAILAVGLTTGLLASYIGLPVAFSQAAGPEYLRFVPPHTALLGYADVEAITKSDFRERFRKFEPNTKERDEFQAKTGVNIDEDIQSVVAAMIPAAAGATQTEPGVLVIARGRFEQSRLEALALEHDGKVEEYMGKRLLTHVKENGDADMAVGFLDADLLALGSYTAVKQAIDAGGGNNIMTNTEMMRQINDLESSSAWAVGRFDAITKSTHIPAEIQAHMPPIQWFSAATHINGGVSGVFKAEARDDESGQNLRDMVRGFLALAKMQASSKPEIKAAVDALQLSGEGRNVAISFTVPSEIFDLLEGLANKAGHLPQHEGAHKQ